MPVILGIESTAHTFGVGIVKNEKILANIKKTYTTEKGGIIPAEAAKHHQENKEKIYSEALEKTGIKENEIDAIAFSQGPGLAPCLIVGLNFAKELSKKLEKPLIPVNHCIAHLEVGKTTGAKEPLMLYVSGANTQVIAYEANKYRIFGETLDIGAGNFIDTFARYAGIGFPGGPKIQELAKQSHNYIELPYKVKGMDVAFSGILTNLRNKIEKVNKNLSADADINKKLLMKNTRSFDINSKPFERSETNINYTLSDLSYSMQETIFAMLVETAERALAHTGKKELLLGGGVACNTRLQEMCRIMCNEREDKIKFFVPENSLLVDNGAMIAFLGEVMLKKGISTEKKDFDKLDIKPRQRTDEVEVKWK